MGQFTNREHMSNFSAHMSHRPTPGLKKNLWRWLDVFGASTCESRPSQTFSCVNDSKHLSIALAESAEKCVGRKDARESCSSVQDFIE